MRFVKKLSWTLKTFLKQLLILIVVFAVVCIIVAAAFKINGFSSVKVFKNKFYQFLRVFKKGALLILVNAYGLIVLTFLLGYGLVQFPWFVWSCSYPEYLLKCELSKSDDFFQKNRESQVELNEAAKTYQNVIEKIPKVK